MKKILFIAWSIILLTGSCSDAEYQIIDNEVYIAAAASSIAKAESVTLANGADIPILVRLAKPTTEDVEVQLQIDASLLDHYNTLNSATLLPVSHVILPSDAKVLIPAGEISGSYTIRVADFDTNGDQYALGVRLGSITKGQVRSSASASSFIYVLSKPLLTAVPEMSGVNGEAVRALPEADWGISTNQWSLECWTKMSAFSRNNQAIFTTGSAQHEIYIRFGDANRPFNYLQIKTLGGQVQTASNLEPNRWYHWAFVYDGTTLSIYRDGELDVRFSPPAPAGGSVRFDFLRMIGSGANWFRDRCQMGQVRLWKTAITEAQIRNNMYFAINPNNPNLIAYWPMDEGEGNMFKDITGNGHDATAGTNILRQWFHDVDFRN